MQKLSTTFNLRIVFTPAAGVNPSRIIVSAKGGEYNDYITLYNESNPDIEVNVDHISLQSHWGSGVEFSNINLQ